MSYSNTITKNDLAAILGEVIPVQGTDMSAAGIEAFIEGLDVSGINAVDYVIEQGTSGIWTYRKWNSGMAECWGTHSWTITGWSAWGNLYESTNSYANYPSGLFIEAPFVQIVANCEIGSVGVASVEVWTGASATRTPQVNLIRGGTGATNTTGAINIYAKGNWK